MLNKLQTPVNLISSEALNVKQSNIILKKFGSYSIFMNISDKNNCLLPFNTYKNQTSFRGNSVLNKEIVKLQPEIMPSNSTLKAYYMNSIKPAKINFGRTKEEHESWGAVHNEKTGETSFKLYTFPDAKKVEVLIYQGKNLLKLHKDTKDLDIKTIEMSSERNKYRYCDSPGVFSAQVPEGIKPGNQYCFQITKSNGAQIRVPDPYSMKQPRISGWSVVTDNAYEHIKDAEWLKNPSRIVRDERVNQEINGKNIKFTPLSAAVIYEAHIGALTKEGTFEAAIKEDENGNSAIKKIKELGYNSIEIMPLENINTWEEDGKIKGYNWGYDGVNKFATREDYGGAKNFKKLIDYCHKNDLSVIVDFVPNHIGPDGNYLSAAGPYTAGSTGWGDQFFLEKGDNRYPRDYVTNMALNWLRMGADGLRADMTSQMGSDSTMKQIAAEANHHFPDAVLIAEDGRRWNAVTNGLEEQYKNNSEETHDKNIEFIMTGRSHLNHLGFDSKWGFEFHHALAGSLIGRWEPCIGNVFSQDMNNLFTFVRDDAGSKIVHYIMSHDEKGNHDGTGLITKFVEDKLNFRDKVENPQNFKQGRNWQIGEQLAQRMCTAYTCMNKNGETEVNGEMVKIWGDNGNVTREFSDKVINELESNVLINKGIQIDLSKHENLKKENFEKVFNDGVKSVFIGNGVVFGTPGPKMIFQNNIDLTPFRFFRKFEIDPEDLPVKNEKGYNTGEKSFIDSKFSTLENKYSDSYKLKMEKADKYLKKLAEIAKTNTALQNGKVADNEHPSRVNNKAKVLAIHAYDKGNEIFSIANFGDRQFDGNDKYGMKFPAGKWQMIVCSNDKEYGGDGSAMDNPKLGEERTVESDGIIKPQIEIPRKSFMMFKKVN